MAGFKFDIPFTVEEIQEMRAHFKPKEYDPASEEKFRANMNRIWARPVRKVMVPIFREESERLLKKLNVRPKAALIVVGNDPGSISYVTNLDRLLAECQIDREIIEVPEHRGQKYLVRLLDHIGNDDAYSGIICQLPLPRNFDQREMRRYINPEKDIDALNPDNLVAFSEGIAPFIPATMGGITLALQTHGINIDHIEDVAVIGQGSLVGMPAHVLFGRIYGKTITSTNENTSGLQSRLARCGIVVAGTGKTEQCGAEGMNGERRPILLDIDFGVKLVDGKSVYTGFFNEDAYRASYAHMRNPEGSGAFTQLAAAHNLLTLVERRIQDRIDVMFKLYQDRLKNGAK